MSPDRNPEGSILPAQDFVDSDQEERRRQLCIQPALNTKNSNIPMYYRAPETMIHHNFNMESLHDAQRELSSPRRKEKQAATLASPRRKAAESQSQNFVLHPHELAGEILLSNQSNESNPGGDLEEADGKVESKNHRLSQTLNNHRGHSDVKGRPLPEVSLTQDKDVSVT
jgi:hypothetical protein